MKNTIEVEVCNYHGIPLDSYSDVDHWSGHLVMNTRTGNGVYIPENVSDFPKTFHHNTDGCPSNNSRLEIAQCHFTKLRKYAREGDEAIFGYFDEKILKLLSE